MQYFVEAKANNPTFPNIYHSLPITCIVEKAKEPHRKIPPKIIKTIFNYWVFFVRKSSMKNLLKEKRKRPRMIALHLDCFQVLQLDLGLGFIGDDLEFFLHSSLLLGMQVLSLRERELYLTKSYIRRKKETKDAQIALTVMMP